jgi:hypothetical protein
VDINQQKEQFSSNFVRVVAAVAGYALYKPEVDEDSVDWGIAAKPPSLYVGFRCMGGLSRTSKS